MALRIRSHDSHDRIMTSAIAQSSQVLENVGSDLRRDLVCTELLGGP